MPIRGLFEKLQGYFLALIGFALALIMVIVFLQTFTRFVIFHSLPWSEELSRYLFMFIIMIGLNVAIKDDILIRIDLIDYAAKGVFARLLSLLRHLIGLFAAVVVAVSSTGLFPVGMIQKSPAMRIPMIIMYSVIFTGYALASVAMLFKVSDAAKAMYGAGENQADKTGKEGAAL